MIKEKNVSTLWSFELLTRYTVIRYFTPFHSGGKREREKWKALGMEVLPHQASQGLGRREYSIWEEHLHCLWANVRINLISSAGKQAVSFPLMLWHFSHSLSYLTFTIQWWGMERADEVKWGQRRPESHWRWYQAWEHRQWLWWWWWWWQ